MFLRFEVGNHRSISEPVELSMIAMDKDRGAARQLEELDERVLTVAGIYGANGSGQDQPHRRARVAVAMRSRCRCAIGRTKSPVIRSGSRPDHRSRLASG